MAEDEGRLRGGKIGSRDAWFGLAAEPEFHAFRRWWHREGKRAFGRDLASRQEARRIRQLASGRFSTGEIATMVSTLLLFDDRPIGSKGEDLYSEHAVAAVLGQIAQASNVDAAVVKLVGQILVLTTSDGVRNAAAMTLADLHAVSEIPTLIDVLAKPEIAKQAGTLVFALDELGGRMPLSVLTQLIEAGSYEARAEALFFAQDGRVDFPSTEEATATLFGRLNQIAAGQDRESAEAASLALNAIRSTPSH